ncbi:MAG: RIO1 family regulatory kinase/ATPase domain-containing protein [Candidatus Hodarchaeales archaeon]|jgi:serine/threonine-protein kinase RIO1
MENKEHKQKINSYFSKNRRKFDEHRQRSGYDNKIVIKEVTFNEACQQLLSTAEINKVFSVIGAGKEATVLLAQESESKDIVCAKVFRYHTSTTRNRLHGTKHITKIGMANILAKQEYWNLVEMYNTKIPVPKPRYLLNNIVIMDFINFQDDLYQPAPLLSEVDIDFFDDPEEILYESIEIIAKMFLDAKFIHGDYSDHNLMVTENGLVTMDLAQSLKYNEKSYIDTPVRMRIDKAVNILKTDLNNLNNSFKKRFRIYIDPEEVCQEIVKDLPEKLQDFIKDSKRINPLSHFAPESYNQKEEYRSDHVFKVAKRRYQKKKR